MSARFGRYEALHPIASGGMATVYLARAIGAGGFERLVAVKAMHHGIADDPDFVAMFLDEARVAARIRHPNVVATLDVEQGQDGLFLVMELVEGPSLSALLRALRKKERKIPLGIALRIMVDALVGLHAAHEQTGAGGEPLNIVHRDVSPQNILVGVDGLTKITDFGVARAEARISSTRGGEIKGKLSYMSPQQLHKEPIDRRADVYAAGVVLWELLAGERLFTADNDGALVVTVMTGALRTPRQVDPSVPEPIDRECMRALSLAVAARHPTALAFADALEAAAEEARVPLASPRAVAAFVKEIGAHKPLQVPPVQAGAAPPREPSSPGKVVDAVTRAAVPPEPEKTSPSSSVVLPLDPPGPPRRGGGVALAIAAVALAAVAGAALGVRFLHDAPGDDAGAKGAGAVASSSPPAVTASAPATSDDHPRAPAPPPSAEAPATAVPATTSAASASVTPGPGPSSVPPRTPVHPSAAKPRAGGADEWRPQGL